MNNAIYTRKPLVWFVRETSDVEYSRANKPYIWKKEKIATLLAITESLSEVLEDDIRDRVPPHKEDLELLDILKEGITSFEEREQD
jgi:hypothetical protein